MSISQLKQTLARSARRVALGIVIGLAIPSIGMLITDDVVWTGADFVVAGVLLAVIGVALEMAVRRAGGPVASVGIAALGIAAAIAGQADDAPGLVLIAILLIGSACAMAARIALRSR